MQVQKNNTDRVHLNIISINLSVYTIINRIPNKTHQTLTKIMN